MKMARHGIATAAAAALLIIATLVVSADGAAAPGATKLSARLLSATRVAQTGDGNGYWIVTAGGSVTAFGSAKSYGSMAGKTLAAPITGIVATADGRGYWLIAGDGGVFSFGDARFRGSLGGKTLSTPVVGMAASNAAGSGATGPRGPVGVTGPAGAPGATGATGATGAVGQPHYAYVYNLTPQVVAIEADIAFSNNGAISGFTHTAGTSSITVTNAGTYLVNLSVSGTEPNQFALMVNGAAALGGTFGSGAGTQQNNGQVILTLGAADVLTLRNHSSAAAATLPTLTGGTQNNVNAALVIEQLS